MSDEGTSTGDGVPWILRHAAERRLAAGDGSAGDDGGGAGGGEQELARPAEAPPAYTRPPRPEWQPSPPAFTPPRPRPSPSYESPYVARPARRRLSLGVTAGIVSGAVVLAGAGVGGTVVLTRGGPPSRAEFVVDADDLCRTGNRSVAAIVEPADHPGLTTAAGALADAVTAQVGRLRAMAQPGGTAAAEVAAVYRSMDRAAEAARRLRDAARDQDDPAAVAAATELTTTAADARTRAAAAGFDECAAGLQPGVDAVVGGTGAAVRSGFLALAELYCRRSASDIGAIHIPEGKAGRDFAAYFGATVDILDRMAAGIGAIPAPPGDEARIEEILQAQQAAQAKGREFHAAAADEDFNRMDALYQELAALIAVADAKWDAYGLAICGSQFGT